MKNKKLRIALGLVVLSFMLGGCVDPMYEITQEEESLIAQYAAHIVAKHNIRQTDGMTGILPEEPEETEEDQQEPETEPETENSTENGKDDGSGKGEDAKEEGISMSEALGYDGLTVKFVGDEQIASYQEGNAYSIDANQGNVFYVMNFELTNTTGEEIKVDNVSLNPTFKLIGTDIIVKAEVTVLDSDLSTYLGEIKAGESVKTVLLFEISQDKSEAVKQAELKISIDGTTKSIEL